MYVLFAPLKNLKFHKKKHSFYPTTNGSDSKIGLVSSNGFLNDTNPIWDQLKDAIWWKNYIGLLSMYQLNETPYIYLIVDEDFISDQDDKRTVEAKTNEVMTSIQFLARSFSLGCWLVKDSCVSCQFQYLFDMKRHFVSRIYTNHFPSLSNGIMSIEYFNRREIDRSISWMFSIINLNTWEKQTETDIPNYMDFEGHTFSLERSISEVGTSFYKAILRLEKAQMSGVVTEKIDKYCSLLECIYAINKDHRRNISEISAAFAKRKGYKRTELKETILQAYSIRSDFSHGDEIKYLKDHTYQEMLELSKKMDAYTRFLMIYLLRHTELDYDGSTDNISEVRDYFKSFVEISN